MAKVTERELTQGEKVELFTKIFGDQPELHSQDDLWQGRFKLRTVDKKRNYGQFRENLVGLDGYIVDYALFQDSRDLVYRPVRRSRFYLSDTGTPPLYAADISYQGGIALVYWDISALNPNFMMLEFQVTRDGPTIARFRYRNDDNTPSNIELPLGDWDFIEKNDPLRLGKNLTDKISLNWFGDSQAFRVLDGRSFNNNTLGELKVRVGDETAHREDFGHPSLPFGLEIARRFGRTEWDMTMYGVLPGKSWQFVIPRMSYGDFDEVIKGSDAKLRQFPTDFEARMIIRDHI